MKLPRFINYSIFLLIFASVSCITNTSNDETIEFENQDLLSNYVKVDLDVNTDYLTENEKQIISLLIDASDIIDEIFWTQSIGRKERVMDSIDSESLKLYAEINYGTWDRLNNNEPFIDKFGIKPLGARFYPARMTYKEFESLDTDDKYDLYTLIWKKNDGSLYTIPYNEAYEKELTKIASLLRKAAKLTKDANFRKYLNLRADAFLSNNYYLSDLAWMDNTSSKIDVIIGPIEYDEDKLFYAKAAHGALVLLKDIEWSTKLKKAEEYLPTLQKLLPIDEKYKKEAPLTSADLGVYNILYCTGDFNAGSKKISITLPYDGRVQFEKGSRKLHFKNTMKDKFNKILMPIADIIIDEEQRKNVNFNAFFENTMYYEIGNCLGCRNTINNKGTVKESLKEYFFAMEETKSDILSLFFITKLYETQVFTDKDLLDNYVTYLADIFRSMRFGAENPQARANIVRLNYFIENGAIVRDEAKGTYKVDELKTKIAVEKFASEILKLRGDGDYEGTKSLINNLGNLNQILEEDMQKIAKAGIPKDVYFNQGLKVLGLE